MERGSSDRADGAKPDPNKLKREYSFVYDSCQQCGRDLPFKTLIKARCGIYCSLGCFYADMGAGQPVVKIRCRWCKRMFLVHTPLRYSLWAMFCSRNCYDRNRSHRHDKKRHFRNEIAENLGRLEAARERRDLVARVREEIIGDISEAIVDFSFLEDAMHHLMRPEFSTGQEVECFYARLGMRSSFRFINGEPNGEVVP